MTSEEMELVLNYMIEKMDPQSKDDIKEILGGELPDTAQDAMRNGGLALKRWPKRLMRRSMLAENSNAIAADAKTPEQMFPHNNRLKL